MAFAHAGILREPGTLDVLDAALRSGATVIGGIDPCTLDRDPKGHLDAVFGLAEKHQVEVDIHLHEPGHLGLFSTDLVLERVRALDLRGKVTMSHAYDLGSISESVSRRLRRTGRRDDHGGAVVHRTAFLAGPRFRRRADRAGRGRAA
ncbi:hypothetical protein [Amycolatopsis sp. NPDC051372]|uniref:hypothetical protein n=1 Tax=Amycolatopsis sp. NPDC051372 TaxID=3155669 RepID=UPI0034195A59